MDFQDIRTYAEECLRDAPPPCVSACPLGVDVRGLVSKVRAGRIDAAYRAYSEAVLFPRVVSAFCEAPCRGVCVRERLADGFVDLKKIERGVAEGAVRREGGRYAIPGRGERVAVLGAGLAGLACAHRLASKGFVVTVYGERHGAFEKPFAEAFAGAFEKPFAEAFAEDMEELFRYIDLGWREGEIPGAEALPGEYDAVFQAAGVAAGTGVAAQIAYGLAGAAGIEQNLKIGELSGARAGEAGPAPRDSDKAPAVDERFYELPYDFTEAGLQEQEDALADEALRCPMCNCSVCIDVCPMIRLFRQNPKRIAADLGVSVLPVGGKIMRVASRMMNSCNLCGLCTAVCPAGVDTCAAMEASRRILKESGHMAPAYHDFWMDDLAFSMSDEAYGTVLNAGPGAGLLFFPGCQLAASIPDTVSRTFDFIREKEPGAAMLLGCCGIPAEWAAEDGVFSETAAKLRADWERLGRPEILFACSACRNTFAKALPEARGRLAYEWLALHGARGSEKPACHAAVYDPCNSRGDAAGQAAVRALAEGSGFVLEELALSGGDAACCGFGGHIYPANPAVLEAVLEERAAERPDLPRLTYCANCRDLFLYKGMKSVHILEVLFPAGEGDRPVCGGDYDRVVCETAAGPLPSLTERRENRRKLKARYHTGADKKTGGSFGAVDVPAEVEAKMDRLLLLREDVERAITRCEEGSAKAIDTASGRCIGFHRERLLTVWVEYGQGEEGSAAAYTVYNVYTHRMRMEEGPGDMRGRPAPAAPHATGLVCGRCLVPLEPVETKFSYLGHEFSHHIPRCPKCGQAHIPEELAAGRIAEVEAMLEDK